MFLFLIRPSCLSRIALMNISIHHIPSFRFFKFDLVWTYGKRHQDSMAQGQPPFGEVPNWVTSMVFAGSKIPMIINLSVKNHLYPPVVPNIAMAGKNSPMFS